MKLLKPFVFFTSTIAITVILHQAPVVAQQSVHTQLIATTSNVESKIIDEPGATLSEEDKYPTDYYFQDQYPDAIIEEPNVEEPDLDDDQTIEELDPNFDYFDFD